MDANQAQLAAIYTTLLWVEFCPPPCQIHMLQF